MDVILAALLVILGATLFVYLSYTLISEFDGSNVARPAIECPLPRPCGSMSASPQAISIPTRAGAAVCESSQGLEVPLGSKERSLPITCIGRTSEARSQKSVKSEPAAPRHGLHTAR